MEFSEDILGEAARREREETDPLLAGDVRPALEEGALSFRRFGSGLNYLDLVGEIVPGDQVMVIGDKCYWTHEVRVTDCDTLDQLAELGVKTCSCAVSRPYGELIATLGVNVVIFEEIGRRFATVPIRQHRLECYRPAGDTAPAESPDKSGNF